MKLPPPPWRALAPALGSPRGAAALRFAALAGGAVALWAGVAAPRWEAGRRPALTAEAFLHPTTTSLQAEEIGRAVQGETWCCDLRFVTAEEARAEAAADARVRGLLEAYGANPLMRSWRITLCREELGRWREAAEWLAARPGVHSVRPPGPPAQRALEAEHDRLRLVRVASWALGLLAAVTGLVAQWIAARALGPELGIYGLLGMTPGAVRMRAAWVLLAPPVIGATGVALACALASVGFQFGAAWGAPSLALLPAFPQDAGLWLAAAAGVAGLFGVLLAAPTSPK